jgi:hypothetical protein
MRETRRTYYYKYMLDRKLLPLTDVLEKQRGVVSRDQAIAAGLSRHVIAGRIESGQWQRLHHGVFAAFSGPVPRACGTALEVFTLLRRNGLRTPYRPCVACRR